jgi:hypothetical protein
MEMTCEPVRNDVGCGAAQAARRYALPGRQPALLLASAAVVLSALHFWPFEQSRAWQMAAPPNLAAALGIVLLVGCAVRQRRLEVITALLPHVSVLAFVVLCFLSAAFAHSPGRALAYSMKSCLALTGGYLLVGSAVRDRKSLRLLYRMATLGVAVAIAGCLLGRYGWGWIRFGFWGSGYKYGTYVGILAPWCAVYLLERGGWRRTGGAVLLLAAVVSCATLGALAGIAAGVMVFLVVGRHRPAQVLALSALVLGSAAALMFPPGAGSALRDDLALRESDAVNLRQRYLEWQAQVNLLAERTVTGTGAGSINDYRSEYYRRLPKLNTLAAFDQNGWLACGAEMGILGLICFVWMIRVYSRTAIDSLRHAATGTAGREFAVANPVGLAAACVAHLFSSVHYNGVLIALVLVLALIAQTHMVLGAPHANS